MSEPRTRKEARATATPNVWVPSPEVRLWLYRVLAAAGPLLVFYGFATAEEVALWLGVGGTVLGTVPLTVAAKNVPR